MVRKESKGSSINGSEKAGKGFRNQFWTLNAPSNEGDKGEMQVRPESAVSRQFLPKKQQGTSDAWTKQIQETQNEQKPFNYTPFKSGQISRTPSTSALRGGTPNPQDILQPNLFLQTGFYNPQTLQRAVSQQSQANPYQIYGSFPNNREVFSQNQIGQKLLADKSRANVTAIPRPEVKGQLKKLNSSGFPPPPGPYRPVSAMNPTNLKRPTSRATSDLGFISEGLESRCQSYTTLPRPEHNEFDRQSNVGSEFIKLNKQMSMIYNPYLTKPVTETQTFYAQTNAANQA